MVVLFAVAAGSIAAYQRSRMFAEVRATTQDRVRFQASLAADSVADAVDETRRLVAQLAADPGLRHSSAGPAEGSSGCTLTFGGSGPFRRGHIDVVDLDGTVRCSSKDLPEPGVYADATWLGSAGLRPAIVGPVVDPATGEKALVISAPIGGQGVVASFLETRGVEQHLGEVLKGPLNTEFRIVDGAAVEGQRRSPVTSGRIVGTAVVPSVGWNVEASVNESHVLADVASLSRNVVLSLLASVLLLLIATHVIYRRVARPIEIFSASAREAMNGDPSSLEGFSGPREVVSLAEDFTTLSREVAAELARRQRAEREARASEQSYRLLFAANPQPMWITDAETVAFLEVNDAAVDVYGYSVSEFKAMTLRDLGPAASVDALLESVERAATIDRSGPWTHVKKDGSLVEVEITTHSVTFAGRPAWFVMAEDVTQRERTRRLLEQAQRMESLGQLAGGVAHDFNNILAVILNYADFAGEEVAKAADADPERWGPVVADIDRIGEAGRRAADLTHQLLAFSRGESAPLAPIDLNQIVSGLEPMLHRTLGERVDLELTLSRDLPAVVANAGQLEQVIVNLTVNARDAMPGGGKLLIETSLVDVDENHRSDRPELAIGRYVRLRVSDTGAGMSPEVRDRAFEPLFTTKEVGRGTGFGLATVYGIVTRAGGTVRIYSELGLGTSVSVLLPATDAEVVVRENPTPVAGVEASETVLVVEDDDNVREVAERILGEAGYRVLTAANGEEALELAAATPGTLDLVLTDVVMPDMLGSELAVRLRDREPGLRILLMSGYAPPVLHAGGTLEIGAPLLDKPFSAKLLRDTVRGVLDGPAPFRPRRDLT